MTRSKTCASLILAAIELADHFAILIQSLNGLHVDVTQSLMVKKKFFLWLGQILVLVREYFHVERMHLTIQAVLVLTGWSLWRDALA
jgi:hypothetical protein